MTRRAMRPILALDFGRARIGAAISDELQMLAHPFETIRANEQAPSRVAEIVREKSGSCRSRHSPPDERSDWGCRNPSSSIYRKVAYHFAMPSCSLGREADHRRSSPGIACRR